MPHTEALRCTATGRSLEPRRIDASTPPVRISHQRLKVLARLSESREAELAGVDVARLTELASGTMYPILYALEDGGLLEGRWETDDPKQLGRPRRRFYRITALGERAVRDALRELVHGRSQPREAT